MQLTATVTEIVKQLNNLPQIQITSFHVERIYGGDINETFLLATNSGDFFLKLNGVANGDMFDKELQSLRLLKDASPDLIPEVYLSGTSDDCIFLVMQFLQKGVPSNNCWRTFAQRLVTLHRQTMANFGLHYDDYIGSLPQKNNRESSWHEFYANQRLLYLTRMAIDQKKLPRELSKMMESLCNKLSYIFPDEPPALLHGDLWSGNYMITHNGEINIFDPAIYYGHREMDIAMSLLFGGFDKSFYDHYNSFYPLEKNWRQRIELCQLYPLLVHCILFGGSYGNSVKSIASKYV